MLKYLKERSTVLLTIGGVGNYNKLNDFLLSLRAQIEVRDCRVRDYSGTTALIDVDVRRGTTADIAKRLEQLTSFSVKVDKVQAYTIEAQLQNKDNK